MDWFKVEVKDILYSSLTDKELGLLIKFQALTALKERELTESEINTIIRKKTFINLQTKLKENDLEMKNFSNKVIFFSKKVSEKRDYERLKKRKQRGNTSVTVDNVPRDVPTPCPQGVPITDKIRVDKIREENIIFNKKNNKENFEYFNSQSENFQERKPYSDRILQSVYNSWPKDKRGSFLNVKSKYYSSLDVHDSKDLFFFMSSIFGYLETKENWGDDAKFCVSLSRFLDEWKNYVKDENMPEEDFSVLVNKFEEAIKIEF